MIFLSIQLSVGAETNAVKVAPVTTNTPARNSFEFFSVISQRNIFNPNRSSRGSRNETGDAPKAVRTESFTLVGTMFYDTNRLAFFDSSSSSYKKVVKPGDSIAGYKVTDVAPNLIKLEANAQAIDLAVGQQMRREEEGEWKVSGKAIAETAGSAGASDSSGSGSSPASADEDELVKRLMKKREEELNK